jgi:predicted nuclease with RNAse H fold
LNTETIIGLDLAAKTKNPTGWVLWQNRRVQMGLVYTNSEILACIARYKSSVVAIDAPRSLPKQGLFRKADREVLRRGLRVFPPGSQAMRTLTLRAIKLDKLIAQEGYKTIEVHPTPTRKALGMPARAWKEIQAILSQIGIEGISKHKRITPHEIDAVTAAFTAHLHAKGQNEEVGDTTEGCIIVPKKADWRTLKL